MRIIKIRKILFYLILFGLFFQLTGFSVAEEQHMQCSLCGMDLNKYTHVRYTIQTVDKQFISTCGVQCGLLLQLNLGSAFSSATVTTLLDNRVIPTQDAVFVFKSDIVTDMSPGFIAFSSKEHASRFVKGFGGKVVNFTQAMEIVQNGFK